MNRRHGSDKPAAGRIALALEHAADAGRALDLDDVALALPVGHHRIAEPPHRRKADRGASADHRRIGHLRAADRALRNIHPAESEIARGEAKFDAEGNLVGHEAKSIGHHLDRILEHTGALAACLGQPRSIGRPAIAERAPRFGGGIFGSVDRFEHADMAELRALCRHSKRIGIDETRIDPGAVQRHPACLRRALKPGDCSLAE